MNGAEGRVAAPSRGEEMNHKAYNRELLTIFEKIPAEKRDRFVGNFAEQAKNPTLILGFNIWLGLFGVDRFMLGQPGLGVLKLLTFGGLTIWNFVDHFLVGGIAREQNIRIARDIANSL